MLQYTQNKILQFMISEFFKELIIIKNYNEIFIIIIIIIIDILLHVQTYPVYPLGSKYWTQLNTGLFVFFIEILLTYEYLNT